MRHRVINLDRSPERLRQFFQRNAHLAEVTRFPAIDGDSIDRAKLEESGMIHKDLTYAPNVLGCAMSHLALWSSAVTEDRAVTIYEDDIILSSGFNHRAAEAIAALGEDWDFVLWGYGLHNFIWIDIGISSAEIRPNQVQSNLDGFEQLDVRPTILKLLHVFSLACYSISPRGAKAMLEMCLPLRPQLISFERFPIVIENVGIDCAMNGIYHKLQAYIAFPPLGVPDPSLPSTIGYSENDPAFRNVTTGPPTEGECG